MKNAIKLIGIIAIVAIIVAACGGDSPKALAKQSYDLFLQYEKSGFDDPAVAKKLEVLGAKVEKLSEADMKIFEAEFERLFGD
ncbi:MAG: hypothetical protein LBH44_05115 [Treponema sp.]|nr:hypothetical protein [Treponema sp.]